MRFSLIAAALGLAVSLSCQAASELSYQYDGKEYKADDMPAALRIQLYDLDKQVNEQRQKIIEQYLLDNWIRQEAKAKGKTPEAMAEELLTVPRPDEKALKAYYDANWERIQQPFKQAKAELEGVVWMEQQQKKADELLQRIKTEKNYKLNLPLAEAPVFKINTEGYPSKGKSDAPVTIVEFSDFQCPHCKLAAEEMPKAITNKADKVRLVYRYMPINSSGISRKVAEGAVCASQQDKFWEYHDLAFAKQKDLKMDSPLALAKELKLDEAKFKSCFEDAKTAAVVTASEEEARQLGVTGTPSFFINGKPLSFQVDMVKEAEAAIDAALIPAADLATSPSSTSSSSTSSGSKLSTCTASSPSSDGSAAGGCKPDDLPASSSSGTTTSTSTAPATSSSSTTTPATTTP